MTKVITYGTYDLLHYGHIALLKRAKALGDYLIVGVTADAFDRERGKLNVTQSLGERIEAVRKTGLADQIIVEEYTGQKISDIQKYNVDIFTVGSDWVGKFDYLSEYCQVVYLPRTQGVSSTELRASAAPTLKMGIVGIDNIASRFLEESRVVSGLEVVAAWDPEARKAEDFCLQAGLSRCGSQEELYEKCNAVFLNLPVDRHFDQICAAIAHGCHVLVNPPMFLRQAEAERAFALADAAGVVLFEGIKTLYFPAFEHMLLLVKSGLVGAVKDIDVSCSQIPANLPELSQDPYQGSFYDWCTTALLPMLKIYETPCQDCQMIGFDRDGFNIFTRGTLEYKNATASFRVGRGIKVEGELVITGTKGYIYVPAPWWRTEYFELRSEDLRNTKKYFYTYEGEGLRYMLYRFLHAAREPDKQNYQHTRQDILRATAVMERFHRGDYRKIPY